MDRVLSGPVSELDRASSTAVTRSEVRAKTAERSLSFEVKELEPRGSGADTSSGLTPPLPAGRSTSGLVPRGLAVASSVAHESRSLASPAQSSTVPMLGPLHAGPARDPLLPSRGQALSTISSEDRSDAGDD